MNYTKIYNSLCERGKQRKKNNVIYYEKHHIIPEFMYKKSTRNLRHNDGVLDGDPNDKSNICYLTAREHFIAHLLLCKLWKDTKWSYRFVLSVKMFLNKGHVNYKRNIFDVNSRALESYIIKNNKSISDGKKGTFPAKDIITGERIGIVSVDHENVISGKWVHITKGIKKDNKSKLLSSFNSTGLKNANSKYSDEEIFESFKISCLNYKRLLNMGFWIFHAEKNDLPYLKSFKQFRFNNMGFCGLVYKFKEYIKENKLDINIEQNFYSHEWRSFVKKEKQKWQLK